MFAICNYVPDDMKPIREVFRNLYVYYPQGGNDLLNLTKGIKKINKEGGEGE